MTLTFFDFLMITFAGLIWLLVWAAGKATWEENRRRRLSQQNKPSTNQTVKKEQIQQQPIRKKTEPPILSQVAFIPGQPARFKHFFGREAELQRIFGLWHTSPQCIAILGEPGIGKTSLLLHLKDLNEWPQAAYWRMHREKNGLKFDIQYQFIYVDFQNVEFSTQKGLLEYILEEMFLDHQQPVEFNLPDEKPLAEFAKRVRRFLTHPCIILLDEFETVENYSKEFDIAFWNSLRSLVMGFSQNLNFVIASTQSPLELQKLTATGSDASPFFNLFADTIHLEPFSKEEAKQFITHSSTHFSEEDISSILEKSERKPDLLQELCKIRHDTTNNDWQTQAKARMTELKK